MNPKRAVAIALGLMASGMASAQSLVSNGGFETGDLTGWTFVAADAGSDFRIATNVVHSGRYSAAFGALDGLDDTIYQDLSTTAGANYTLTFWVAAEANAGHLEATIAGSTVVDITGQASTGFYEYTYKFAATAADTRLAFMGNNGPDWYYLDDVSVATVPEVSTALMWLLGIGLGGATLRRRSRSAKRSEHIV